MPHTSANVHNLNDSRAQALEALSRVSDRLGEILGEAANLPGDGTSRNEHGELVNEDGLPIIDITEPIDDLDTPSLSAATEDEVIEEDSYPEPISSLSPEALAISRKHRDKILELLEEEEAREERRTRAEQQAELERKRESARIEMQKRMVTQSTDLEKRRQAKEMNKRMGKALVNGLGEPEPAVDSKRDPQLKDAKEKKSVTFANLPASPTSAEVPEPAGERAEPLNWGDVVPGRLSKKQRSSGSQTQPMKMEVVERAPAQSSSTSAPPLPLPSKPSPPAESTGDSDDESDSELDSDTTIALESGDEDVVLSAHRHRELALEYHRRREALASSARDIHPEDLGLIDEDARGVQDDWDTEDVPLEATLAHPPPKASVSKFKASLSGQGDDHTLPSVARPSTSHPVPLEPALSSTFGISVLSPSALSKSVKMGKLVGGNLVAGDEDEDEKEREEREEEEIRKLLLKSMEDYSGIASQVMGPKTGSYWAKPEAEEAASPSRALQQPAVKAKPKTSRFKVNRTQARPTPDAAVRPSTMVDVTESGSSSGLLAARPSTGPRSSTPLSDVERSSPKLSPGDRNHILPANFTSPSKLPQPTIIDSPSFAPRRDHSSASAEAGSSSLRSPKASVSQQAVVINSPSFQAPQYTIMESPSFMRPLDASTSPDTPLPRVPSKVIPTPSTRPAATAMTDDVRERSGNHSSPVSSTSESKPQRVSRFKAERGG